MYFKAFSPPSRLWSAVLLVWWCAVPSTLAAYPDPGDMTQGGVWPLPQQLAYLQQNLTFDPKEFAFVSTYSCDITDEAVKRYSKFLAFPESDHKNAGDARPSSLPPLLSLHFEVAQACPPGAPQLGMDESYKLTVSPNSSVALLKANQVWGVLRGMETFSQLFFLDPATDRILVRSAEIKDFPRFAHRGVLLDTSRHFQKVKYLLQNIELMAQNKLNVFHWHIVDDPSFPFESKLFPNLSGKGAYTQRHVYTQEDVKYVIGYARLHGIRVVAEFDTPGHTQSWGFGYPDLLCDCFNGHGGKEGNRFLINPTREGTWDFLLAFLREVLELFPDHYIHLGGDEVSYWMERCWARNPEISGFMSLYGFNTSKQLENYYFQHFLPLVNRARKGANFIVWQEVLDNAVHAPQAIAHVWKGGTNAQQMAEMAKVTSQGHLAMLSSCWYLDYINYGPDERERYYNCDPQGFQGTQAQKNLVLGGEAALWGEMVDSTNVVPRLWPRASVVAERLWSDKAQTPKLQAAWPRLHEHRCRMVHRGHPAEPVDGPSFCPFPYDG